MSAAAPNMLLQNVEYVIQETDNGIWRRFLYPNGRRFAEFKTHLSWGGLPLIHYTYGMCPETGKRITAHGIIAIGRIASGVIAIGQVAMGLIAIGQLSIGLLLGVGQASFGAICLGQLALGVLFGAGQFATGQIAIGQLAYGGYVLAQLGWGKHVVDTHMVDPAAKTFFLHLVGR
ncbi:MAG TPA: hypothetical protein VFW73_00655 [Lacipirellulaceae bacterium]|nr:hypothetical protein [Lacipirellulaceae bacterium]